MCGSGLYRFVAVRGSKATRTATLGCTLERQALEETRGEYGEREHDSIQDSYNRRELQRVNYE